MELSEQTFDELSRVIHRLTGLVVGKDKSYLVKHRLQGVAQTFGCESYEAFARELRSVGSARLQDALIEAITTKETAFFRDHWLFEALQSQVLPDCASVLAGSRGSRHRIRIWSAAASTGQEAYSLAMLVREQKDKPDGGLHERQVGILASDISAEALKKAKEGLYSTGEVGRGVSETRQRRHFRRVGERWQIDEALRQLVQFRRLDLLHPPADLGPFDVVLCRNVLIYFDQRTRERVCRHIYGLMEPGGWLALGSAESLYGVDDRLEMVKHGRAVLYRKPIQSRHSAA